MLAVYTGSSADTLPRVTAYRGLLLGRRCGSVWLSFSVQRCSIEVHRAPARLNRSTVSSRLRCRRRPSLSDVVRRGTQVSEVTAWTARFTATCFRGLQVCAGDA